MCGTASRSVTPDQIVASLNVQHVYDSMPPVYNIKPSTPVVILRPDKDGRIMDVAHWWLTPAWIADRIEFKAKEDGRKGIKWLGKPLSLLNIRYDTITDPKKPYWAKLLARQRCGMVVDGFVEWPDDELRDKAKPKTPALFYYKDRAPFCLGALWEMIEDDEGKPFYSCTVITTEPNGMLKRLPHKRMPVMLRGDALDKWLDPEFTDAAEAAKLCRTTPDEEMGAHFISSAINKGTNNFGEMLEPTESY